MLNVKRTHKSVKNIFLITIWTENVNRQVVSAAI